MGKHRITKVLAIGALAAGIAACGGKAKDASTSTTSGGAAGDATTTVAGGGGSTAVSGSATGTPGAVGYFAAFKYTVKSVSVAPNGNDSSKKVLTVVLDYENVGKSNVSPKGSFSDFKLDGDQFQAAENAKASPEGEVAPGTKGTVTVTFDVGASFDASKVSLVIGDPNNREAAILPLGSSGKKATQERKETTISASLSGLAKGASFTATKATLTPAFPERNDQAEKGKTFLFVSGTLTGGSEETSVNYPETKIKQPDGSIKEAEGFIDGDQVENNVTVSAGQKKDIVIVFVVEQKTKAAGTYELQLASDSSDQPVKATFSIS